MPCRLREFTAMLFTQPRTMLLGLGVPGAVAGYMPQYPTLHNFFTPREILAYYGRIFGVDNVQV